LYRFPQARHKKPYPQTMAPMLFFFLSVLVSGIVLKRKKN